MPILPFIYNRLDALRPSNRALYRYYHDLAERQHHSLEQNRAYQRNRLHELLSFAVRNVPYYREVARERGIALDPSNADTVLSRFPVLTKSIIWSRFDDLKTPGFEGRFRTNTSGGSTGEQATFLQDYTYIERGIAWEMVFYEWVGRKNGDTLIKLWGSERDFLEGTRGFQGFKQRYLENVHLLNSFRMSETDMTRYVEYINHHRPRVLEAYVQSVFEFAQFIVRESLDVFSPQGIICSAGTLYPHMKKTISDAFASKIFNRYGSREVGGVAHSCEHDMGLHVNVFGQFVEILNDDLEPCSPGEMGEIYITNLDNYVMPLIRFKIGDIAVVSGVEQCECGRGLPMIDNVVGRSGCMIRTEEGAIDSTALTTSFYFFDSIKRYQFVQKSLNRIVINVDVHDKVLWEKERINLVEKMSKLLGPSMNVEFQVVDSIEPSPSGKHLYFISELE
jgi:phenylacetate-CoA ligase